jgi:hypothetical protein
MNMAYKIMYIEDQVTDSRESDLKNLGFDVKSHFPSANLKDAISVIKTETDVLILDYSLTQGSKGENNAFYDAPTIAATLRSKPNSKEIPIFLMSNESKIVLFNKDFANQNLFDYAISKKNFINNKEKFGGYVKSFITAYSKIKSSQFDLVSILGLGKNETRLIHSKIESKLKDKKEFIFEHSRFINDTLIHAMGPLIGVDVLSARLGIAQESDDWKNVLKSLKESNCDYSGIFCDIHQRWWMSKVTRWWEETLQCDKPLRRLDADERVQIIKEKLSLTNLGPAIKTTHSKSSNFWTICKYTKCPLDPFDGIELMRKDLLPWQEKEYFSFDAAIESKHEEDKDFVSEIDKKAIRDLIKTL